MRRAFAVALLLVASFASKSSPRPNFVVLFLDDHGWGDVGCNTNGTVKETPHIDALAAGGMRFTDFHVGYSVCTASRGALLTGRLCPRTGVCGNFGPNSEHGMALSEHTMADLLKPQGYDTHMIGKWHLGHNEPYSPTYRGFDTYYGLPFSGDMGCIDSTPQGCKPEYSRTKGQPACPALCPPDSVKGAQAQVGIPLYDSTGVNCSGHASCNADIVVQPFNPLTLNTQYAARAKDILSHYGRSSGGDSSDSGANSTLASTNPFLLYVAFAHTHTPLAYDEERFGNASARPGWYQVFGNTLAEVDNAVGEIYAGLEAEGLAENTLILLTADNGPADLSSVACEDVGSQGPFTGAWQRSKSGGGGGGTAKGTTWEGGHRTVGIAHWKGTVGAAQVSDALVSSVDFVPTLVSLSGGTLPADREYDGVDLTKVLRGEATDAHHTLFHPHSDASGAKRTAGVPAMRLGRYKAHFQTMGSVPCREANGTHRDDGGKTFQHDPPLIFDLDTDPAEANPIDPTTIPDIVAQIQHEYDAFWVNVNSTKQSKTEYNGDRKFAPCGNVSSPSCRTNSVPAAVTIAMPGNAWDAP